MKKIINKITERKSIIILIFLVIVFYAVTFAITYGRKNDPTIVYTNDKLSGIIDNVVHVNDLDADYYFYKGQNYTKSDTGALPSGDDQNIYPDSKLVEVELTYSGVDINSGDRGYVSLGELQDTYIYYKIFPVNDNNTPSNYSDDYIEIELIENPFTNRPTNKGFNGWVTNYQGSEISIDRNYYIRTAKVPVDYNGSKPEKIDITFSASWVSAATSLVNTSRNWSTAFNSINSNGMELVPVVTGQSIRPLDMTGYFRQVNVSYGQSYVGYYSANGTENLDPSDPDFCIAWEVPVGAEVYDANGILQISEGASGDICYKEGMLVFKDEKSYNNIATSGGEFDVLIVAGGGSGARSGGGSAGAGGGGAGGLLLEEDYYINTGNHTVQVGAGGVANSSSGDNDGRSGENSNAFGLTAIGGGGGGARSSNGLDGGSGGGGGSRGGLAGNGTFGQGNNGGDGDLAINADNAAGGGGGFSSSGTVGISNDKGGDGGNGFNASSLFGTVVGNNGWFSGGGGGGISGSQTAGIGGLGGGGLGGLGTTDGEHGQPNTGGGGGGSPRSVYGAGDGGSGVVIVRWDASMQSSTCQNVSGCTYYEIIENEYFDSGDTYYELNGDSIQVVAHQDLPFVFGNDYVSGFDDNSVMAGYFRLINIPRYSSITGYYDSVGYLQSGTCNTSGGCNLYELIQYYDNSDSIERPLYGTNYYHLVTRDTNIVIMTSNLSNTWASAQNKPFTLTSVHNGVDYRGSVLWNTSRAVNAYNDTNIENIRMSTTENVNNTTPPSNTTTSRVFYGRWQNIRFGRGITQDGVRTNFRTIVGGANAATGNSSNITRYRVIIESGLYSTISIANSGGTANTYIESKALYGNDYDRVSQNNDNLYVNFVASGSWGGNLHSSNNNVIPSLDLVVKSGSFGGGESDHTTGIYVGGRGGGTHNSPRIAKIEGGWIYNLIGGPLTATNKGNINDTFIYMTGGEVDVIIGGAGTTATYGHRILQLTGGTVNYSAFGGSNAYNGSGTDGTVRGSSFVYVGGVMQVGNASLVASNSTLWGAEAGSIFGIGNGRSGYDTIGSSDNSTIIIQDDALIRRNVYGGGNYGATGISSGTSSTYTKIKMIDGTINGDLYGGGNSNGSGNGSVTATIGIEVYDGTINGALYGGSNTRGTIFGSVAMDIYDGTFNVIYGGGRGGYLNSSNPGTYIRNGITINIGDSTAGPTIANLYGGSAYGSVNIINQGTTQSNDGVNIVVENGTVTGSIFGGGKGDATYAPNIAGPVNVTVNGGNIATLFGGNDANGDLFRNSRIYLNNGIIGDVYGGGNQVQANTSYIYLQGSSVTNLYGGSNQSGDVTQSYITTTSGTVNTIYGGNNAGGKTLNTDITINGGSVTTVYGGGKLAHTDSSIIRLNSSTITNVYGGGESANLTVGSEILVNGSNVTNLYGGSNVLGNVLLSEIIVTTGNVTNLYGGNNAGGKTSISNITINGGFVTTTYGGGKLANSDQSIIDINGGTLDNVYGGGENASMLIDTRINVNGSTLTRVYGGSNFSGTVPITNVTFNSGNAVGVYGGNNAGGNTITSNVTINGGIIENVYGGGREASTTTSNLIVNRTSGIITNVHGGGHSASVNVTNVTINGGSMESVYGGSNFVGDVATSNVFVNSQAQSSGAYMSVTYTANNTESWQSTTYPTIVTATVTVHNNTANIIDEWNGTLFIPESTMYTNYSQTLLTQSGDEYSFNQANRYFGTNTVPANGTYSFEVTFLTMQSVDDITVNYNFNGTSTTDQTYSSTSNYIPNIGTIYGGNNAGGTTNNTILNINNANVGTIYGGGNQAIVTNNTIVDINGTNISGTVYGGGNFGGVSNNTLVTITGATVLESVYAGGNGATAVVDGSTSLSLDGDSVIGQHVFGGGNAAATGSESTNNSVGVVNISGGTIGGNVYGGANTSVLYGTTNVNIGYDIPSTSLLERNIHIVGTVFGGGEANASGDENYDYSFISVTNGISINIDGNSTNSIDIDGSIFGSGNASSTTGYSSINIRDYGTMSSKKQNVSIQRANMLIIDNSHIELFGATDRTNEYSTTLFTISRIKEMKLKNNSIIYLETGANLLEKVSSLVDVASVETRGFVTIDGSSVNKNVDNRIYMKEGKNLNIATNESVTAYGEVNGMIFFGMFSRDRDGFVDEAYFDPNYNYGDTVAVGEFYHFSSGSYVLGRHSLNHDITIDGFYTNYENEDSLGTVAVRYINPTPEDSNYYMWVVGESVASYDISIAASKYSTLGTYELPLLNFYHPNTTFSVVGANFNELASDFELVRQNQIPRIATDGKADTRMSLVMKTSNTGWITVGETNFLTEESNPIFGTDYYVSENSTVVPSLLFYIYHSKNLETSGSIGIVTISLLAVTPIDDLTNDIERININIDLSRVLYSTNDYEGAMTAGEEHDMFVTTLTDITNKSKLSAYFSLYAESETTIYQNGDYRALVSSFVFPENTKLTMIDLIDSTPVYYYYVVTAQDVIAGNAEYAMHNEVSYRLSKFIKMGSSSLTNNFKDTEKNIEYYDPDNDIAHEEFVFIVDFGESNILTSKPESSLLIELRNSGDQTRISVLGIQHLNMMYNLYADHDAIIELDPTLSKNNIYVGETVTLNVLTNFNQQVVASRIVQDTTFYYQKLGVKITILDEDDNVVNGVGLMGLTYKYGGVTYYPQMSGAVRINIAPRVANVLAKIEINTKNTNLPSGNYKIKIESFGSPDGIYYGLESSDTKIVTLGVLNNIYGLDVSLPDTAVIVNKTTGFTLAGNNALIFGVDYSSGLASPNLRLSLKRRNYDQVQSTVYDVVDLMDYITNNLTRVGATEKYEYLITNNPLAFQNQFIYLKENLVTGTYKFTFSIYDGNNYIGEVYKYVIIK